LFPEIEYIQSGFNAVSKLLENKYGVKNIYSELITTFHAGEKEKTFDKTLDNLGIKYNESLINEIVKHYRAHNPKITPYSDVLPTLHYLKQRYLLALLTDGYLDVQKNKLQALNIRYFFHKIIYTDKYGKENWKPNAFAYQIIMDYFSVNGSECVYIGDNVEKDFYAPNQLGWTTIQIKRDAGIYLNNNIVDKEFGAKIIINNFLELKDSLK